MSRVLFVTSIYRTGEKIFPVIPALSQHCDVDVLLNSQMSRKCPWSGDVDIRRSSYKMFRKYCKKVINGKPYTVKNDSRGVLRGIRTEDYDLILFDDNKMSKRLGTTRIASSAHKVGVKVAVCPHGSSNYDEYPKNNIDRYFVFGDKDKDYVKSNGIAKYPISAGIPSNDELKKYSRGNKYVLFIANAVHEKKTTVNGIRTFSSHMVKDLGLLKISQSFDCELVIKLKVRHKSPRWKNRMFDRIQNIKEARVIKDVEDDNKLIADARAVIACPSTLVFKSIQMGIPTVILEGFGQNGSFHDFDGLIQPSYENICKALDHQTNKGRDIDFISRSLAGGVDYSSTGLYVKNILRILEE